MMFPHAWSDALPWTRYVALLAATAIVPLAMLVSPAEANHNPEGTWTLIEDDAPWIRRAGLQVLEHRNALYLMGGRTARPPRFPPIPGDSDIWGDVWKSTDDGETWTQILATDDDDHWPARAYFEAVKKGPYLYILGGQNFKVIPNPDCPPPYMDCFAFLPNSDFFNDVWRSKNGVDWYKRTDDAGWHERAGLSAIVFRGAIYVMGGSFQDDPVFGGERIYFNDVWRSYDGRTWHQVTDAAPWAPRAGAAVVKKSGYIYLLGGEAGFFCEPQPCDPPYFNDVWRTRDGENWELVTEAAGWSARPGHKCAVVRNRIYCFGGFGFPTNPMDVWQSKSGFTWEQISSSPWNAVSPDEIKYDFDVVVKRSGWRREIHTFGGDRETFDFTDSLNYLRLDNDVWKYDPPLDWPWRQVPDVALAGEDHDRENASVSGGDTDRLDLRLSGVPSAFRASTELTFIVPTDGEVSVGIYDVRGRRVRDLGTQVRETGSHRIRWDGRDDQNRPVAAGAYFAAVRLGPAVQTVRLVRLD